MPILIVLCSGFAQLIMGKCTLSNTMSYRDTLFTWFGHSMVSQTPPACPSYWKGAQLTMEQRKMHIAILATGCVSTTLLYYSLLIS